MEITTWELKVDGARQRFGGEDELSVDALYGRADGPFWKPLQRAIK